MQFINLTPHSIVIIRNAVFESFFKRTELSVNADPMLMRYLNKV